MKRNTTLVDETVTADSFSACDFRYTGRAPALPLLGWIIGGSVSLLLWTALSLSAWALLMR